ncbi:MAG: penicillin-binding protein 2 [Candidatus Binataceae bacterium]|nr:penicillin-binding protein 2 [Candidatus Binataceae bacterium]
MKFRYRRKELQVPRLELRVAGLSLLIVALMTIVVGRLYYLQVVRHQSLAELADRNRIRIRRLPALRGLVFDRHHRPLVDTVPSFDAVIVPEDVDDLSATIERLEQLLGGGNVAERLQQAEDDERPAYDPITVEEHLDWNQVVALETHQLELPGVSLQVNPRRHYLYGQLAAHLLGYVGEVSRTDLQHPGGYANGDQIGKFGLERGWENFLRGDAGGQEIEVDAVGRRLRLLREIPERPGDGVVLTIDLDLQQVAEQALGDRSGALVAIDPKTGYILAMVSHPAFDPNIFTGGITPADWHRLMVDPGHPLQNRTIQGIYAPGSTFKIVDAIAGLQDRTLTSSTTYNCPGGLWYGNREYRCWRKQGHGTLALHRALVESCDVFFYQVGAHLGVDRIAQWGHLLGLGQKTGIDLANEKTGIIPSSQWKRNRYHERWYPAETLSVAIGQGYVSVTPLQMAQLAAEVANGGVRYKPQFVKEVDALDGTPLRSYPPVIEQRLNIDQENLDQIRDALCDVVNGPGGTARKAALPNIVVCGKTGTAQVVAEKQGARTNEKALSDQLRDNGWFIAFAPKDNPQIAIAMIVEHGGHGGSAAAPAVRDVLEKFFALYPVNTPVSPAPAGHPEIQAKAPQPREF